MSGAVLVGILSAVQARVNGELGVRLDDGAVAAAISFGSGLVIVLAIVLLSPSGRRALVRLAQGVRARTIPWWMLAGGAAGATTVMSQGLVAGVIGVSLFTVGIVAGQTLGGLLLDRIGYGPAGHVAVTAGRVVGTAFALVAVGISLVGSGSIASGSWWMVLLPFIAGVGIAWQQATNGRLRVELSSAIGATTVNFAGGTLILVTAALISVSVRGGVRPLPPEAWLYAGGAVGVAYIAMSAAIVARTGVLLMGLAVVVGQLVAAAALDVLYPAAGSPGLTLELVTVGVALAAVAVAAPWRRMRRRPTSEVD